MIELDTKFVFHIPLYKFKNNELVPIDINKILEDLISELSENGYENLFMTEVKGFYKKRTFDEILLTIFVPKIEIDKEDIISPEIIFKEWFKKNNNLLEQESLAYELNNKMFIESL